MADLELKGKVVNVRCAKTVAGKDYSVIVVEQKKRNGDPLLVKVRSWDNNKGFEVGSVVDLPVYVRAFITKRGTAAVDYVLRSD